jgi:hypothetical protein
VAAAKYIEYPAHDLPRGPHVQGRMLLLIPALPALTAIGATGPFAFRRRPLSVRDGTAPPMDPAVQTSTVEG